MAISVRSRAELWLFFRNVFVPGFIVPTIILVLAWIAGPASIHGCPGSSFPRPTCRTTPEIRWEVRMITRRLALVGIEQVNLVGNPSKPGPYTLRLKFPAGYKLAPHAHPDDREVTILSGTWYLGYGEQFDKAALKALPAGRFYTEPANVAHFVEVREEPVMIQVSGTGPSGRKFVNPADNPK